jgi:hypothetical protein
MGAEALAVPGWWVAFGLWAIADALDGLWYDSGWFCGLDLSRDCEDPRTPFSGDRRLILLGCGRSCEDRRRLCFLWSGLAAAGAGTGVAWVWRGERGVACWLVCWPRPTHFSGAGLRLVAGSLQPGLTPDALSSCQLVRAPRCEHAPGPPPPDSRGCLRVVQFFQEG